MTSEQLVEDILLHIDRLPEVPMIAFQVNQMLNDPDVDAQTLSEVITKDPSLTAQILKLCNSAEYGFSRKISTISEAVAILGHDVLKRIIYTIISHSLLNRPVEGYALEKGDLWFNAVTCGSYARHIAKRVNFGDSELVMVAALLRDIGKIALESYIIGNERFIEEAAHNNKSSYDQAEQEILGVSHTVLGARLAQRWNFPENLINVILYHHHPATMPKSLPEADKTLICLVHLADCITLISGNGLGVDGLMYPLEECIFDYLDLPTDSQAFEALYAELLDLEDEITSMSATFTGS